MGNGAWFLLVILLVVMATLISYEAYMMGYHDGWIRGYRRGVHIKRGDTKHE